MHLGLRELESFLDRHREDRCLVLATVVATEGSTYRKPGAMMLIRENSEFAGLISGGCLEGDLVGHAASVFADGKARRVTYDLSSDDEVIFSLGLGCGGVVHLLLQRLDRDDGFGVLPWVFNQIGRRRSCVVAMVHESAAGMVLGTTAAAAETGDFTGDASLHPCLEKRAENWNGPRRYQYADPGRSGAEGGVLLIRIEPSPRILVCGAGPDAVPLARQIDALGWECNVVDHRPAYAKTDRFPVSTEVLLLKPAELATTVDLDEIDAAVVMTHNLEHDETYLRQLAPRDLGYLGLLGPRARREDMRSKLGIGDGVIRGPAGLDIGAELPESIALSIIAEIHQVLNRKADG